jgi:outer membrane immunogenic protein
MKHITTTLLATVAAAGLMSSAYAADLIIEEPAPVVGVVDAGGAWDGAYVGAFVGGQWGEVDHTGVIPGLFDEPGADLDIAGWLVGVRAGADFTVSDSIVLGVVGDIAWSNVSGEGLFEDLNFGVDDALVSYELDWQGSVRGRVGFDGGTFLPYLTAGVAFGHMNHSISIEGDPADEGSATFVGWTAGAGVEVAVQENVSLNLEYRYTDLGEKTIDMGLGVNDPSFAITSHTLTAGVNFRF